MFIVFEGIECSGKSTQIRLLSDALSKRFGNNVEVTKEPTDGPIGSMIRENLKEGGRFDDETLQFLFIADRADHVHSLIRRAMAANKVIISDRYMFSTIAYGASAGIDGNWLAALNSRFPKPDIVIFIDVSIDESITRLEKRKGQKERFDKRETIAKLREEYLKLAGQYNFVIVDGNGSIEEVAKSILMRVEQALT